MDKNKDKHQRNAKNGDKNGGSKKSKSLFD